MYTNIAYHDIMDFTIRKFATGGTFYELGGRKLWEEKDGAT